jgi:hypothetical protein
MPVRSETNGDFRPTRPMNARRQLLGRVEGRDHDRTVPLSRILVNRAVIRIDCRVLVIDERSCIRYGIRVDWYPTECLTTERPTMVHLMSGGK